MGSQFSALNDKNEFFSSEAPDGFACLIITDPQFFFNDFKIIRAEKISL